MEYIWAKFNENNDKVIYRFLSGFNYLWDCLFIDNLLFVLSNNIIIFQLVLTVADFTLDALFVYHSGHDIPGIYIPRFVKILKIAIKIIVNDLIINLFI